MQKLKALQEIRDFVSKSKNILQEDIKRIYCKEYMMFFKHSQHLEPHYWQIINNPKELYHGDLIVFTSENTKENHCMIVDKVLDVKKEQVRIQVVDCSQFPHSNDTRINNEKGIGQGEITISHSQNKGWDTYKHRIYNYSGILNFARARQ